MFDLVVVSNGVHRRTHLTTELVVGRSDTATVVISDRRLSERHARFFRRAGEVFVEDLGTSRGTLLNGQRVVGPRPLRPGDRVVLASTVQAYLEVSSVPAPWPVDVKIVDPAAARRSVPQLVAGRRFVFCADTSVLRSTGLLERLLPGRRPSGGRRVKALVDGLDLGGLRFAPANDDVVPVAMVVADRDLYRAEQDPVRLIVARPGGGEARLVVTMNGARLTEREIDTAPGRGLHVETLAMLLPGSYEASLEVAGAPGGARTRFTVAQYSLAPLGARLVDHTIDRAAGVLKVTLAVESYGIPFDRLLRCMLLEGERELGAVGLLLQDVGRYVGRARLPPGEGPYRLRLTADDDPARTAEVVLAGSRRAERELTRVSELGRELSMSLLPEPGALTVRGMHLVQGDFLATPVVVDDVVARAPILRATEDLESAVLAVFDVASAVWHTVELGDVARGATLPVVTKGAVTVVFVGCFVGGKPFEAFTTTFAPETPLALELPSSCAPRGELPITLRTGRSHRVPVLLTVRDERLTAADPPLVALGAAVKRSLVTVTAGMGDDFRFRPIDDLLPEPEPQIRSGRGGFGRAGGLLGSGPNDDDDEIIEEDLMSLDGGFEVHDLCLRDDEEPRTLGRVRARPGNAPPPAGSEPEPPADDAEPVRAVFPEVLFCAVVEVADGDVIRIPLADSLGGFAVEVFTVDGGDHGAASARVRIEKPVRCDLDLAPEIHADDQVVGTLHVACASGRARVHLERDGVSVALGGADAGEVRSGTTLTFAAGPGRWVASAEDVVTGERDAMEQVVTEPGVYRTLVRQVVFLERGGRIALDGDLLSLRVLPGVDTTLGKLVEATAGYGHLCCEQTAAKILSAVILWMTADGEAMRARASDVVIAGIARERMMWRKGAGFSMYPGQSDISHGYTPKVVRYLWSLQGLADLPHVPRALAKAAREGLAMADDVARALGIEQVPTTLRSIEDAYALAAGSARGAEAVAYVERAVDLATGAPRVATDRVNERCLLAYAAAILLAARRVDLAFPLANRVLAELNEDGRLYSTVDSIAAIALLRELDRAGVGRTARVVVNGEAMDTPSAAELSDRVEVVEVVEGVAAVELTRIREERWSEARAAVPVRVGFRGPDGEPASRFRRGDRAELVVSLPGGYTDGDLVHVCLPPSMARLEGGGRVKRFTRDFQGAPELRIPVVVTHALTGPQRFAVAVRNMFEEERVSSPGLVSIDGH